MKPDFNKLKEPFHPADLEMRVGATGGGRGLMLFYVTARAVFDRLDEVFGVDGWRVEYEEPVNNDGKTLLAALSVRVDPEKDVWITKRDVGVKSNTEGMKGMHSDALKRAAVHLGIGRYLYRSPDVWIPLDGKYIPRGVTVETVVKRNYKLFADAGMLPEGYGEAAPQRKTVVEPTPSARGSVSQKSKSPYTPDERKKLMEASKGKDRAAVREIFTADDLPFEDALAKLVAL